MIAGLDVEQSCIDLYLVTKLTHIALHEVADAHLLRIGRKLTVILLEFLRCLTIRELQRLHIRELPDQFCHDTIGEPTVVTRWRKVFEWQYHQTLPPFPRGLCRPRHNLPPFGAAAPNAGAEGGTSHAVFYYLITRRTRGLQPQLPQRANDRINVRHRRALNASQLIFEIAGERDRLQIERQYFLPLFGRQRYLLHHIVRLHRARR